MLRNTEYPRILEQLKSQSLVTYIAKTINIFVVYLLLCYSLKQICGSLCLPEQCDGLQRDL